MKKNININKIKERKLNEEEVKQNEEESKRKKMLMYTLPIIIFVIIGVIYISTNIHYLLIPFAIVFLIFLFGWDANQRTCTESKKWNSLIWIDNKIIVRKIEKQKKNFLGKEKVKNVREKVSISTGKCKNCGKEITFEKSRKI